MSHLNFRLFTHRTPKARELFAFYENEIANGRWNLRLTVENQNLFVVDSVSTPGESVMICSHHFDEEAEAIVPSKDDWLRVFHSESDACAWMDKYWRVMNKEINNVSVNAESEM